MLVEGWKQRGARTETEEGEKKDESAAVAEIKDEELFAFTCTSDYVAVAEALKVPKSRLGACIDSGASRHYCLDRSKFENYRPIEGRDITTADGCTLKAVGIGNVRIELPNGSKHTKAMLKDVIYAPDMAFTLISISRLDNAECSVSFRKGMCTIKNPAGHTMVTIPRSDGLY